MKSSAPIQSWKYHVSILTTAILVIVVGGLIRNLIIKKTEHAETSVLQALQTEVQQLKTSLKRNDLEAISDIVALAAKKAAPAVVSITPANSLALPRPVTTFNDYRIDKRQQSDNGETLLPGVSGLLLNASGEILTTSALAASGKEFQILFADGTKHAAQLIGVNATEHLALLRVQQTDKLPAPPESAATTPIEAGAWLIRLGRSPSGRQSVALGWLEAIRRDAVGRETYFLDAEFTPELDGSPTINLDGQAVGLNVFRSDLGKGVMIPLPHALTVAQAIRTDAQAAPQSWAGVELQDLNDEIKRALSVSQGVLITQVLANSPALRADLRPLDVVIKAEEKTIQSARELTELIHRSPVSTKLRWTIVRAGVTRDITVETAFFDGVNITVTPSQTFGIEFAREASANGLAITSVQPGSAGQRFGLQAGDLLQAINGTAIRSLNDWQRQQRALSPETPQLWLIRRDEQSFVLAVKAGGKAS